MLSKIPVDIAGLRKQERDSEIARAAVIAELDAINLYEQMAALTDNYGLRRVLLDVAREEKTHGGEFQARLLREDAEQTRELVEGKL